MNKEIVSQLGEQSPLTPLAAVIRQLGVSRPTFWRWRDRGWIVTTNIAGSQFVTGEEMAKFLARAASGEFAKQRGNFKRKGSAI